MSELADNLMGDIIDAPFEDFEKTVVSYPLGVISNLIVYLESAYFTLKDRKDAIISLVKKHIKTKEEVTETLEQLYAEMVKIEEKVVFLKKRKQELLKGVS